MKSEKFWDKQSNTYGTQVKTDEQVEIVNKTKKHLGKSDIVLDYACATGLFANDLANEVKEMHGIDISSKMIDAAKREAAKRNIQNVHFAKSTIFDKRYKNESFNVILAFNILHLVEDTQKVVQRIHELLKPGGLFISLTPCMGEKKLFFGIVLFLMGKIGIVPNAQLLKVSELEDALTNRGFHIVETKNIAKNLPNYFIVSKKK